MDRSSAPIVYCHCAYAKVISAEVKQEVLEQLVRSGVAFEAVADLCELAARKDPCMDRFVAMEGLRIAACYPRAVRCLFDAADQSLPEEVEVVNMRELSAAEAAERLLAPWRSAELPA
ncbi:MAG: hypothetical protein KJZ87_19300 [Thermoguttaceae bacterium]|nr:hypothetical protein [Thermoguttaceae bacterium]